ncbi:MAG: hypothetical protein AAF847_05705 [Bacteroidota bacterium]
MTSFLLSAGTYICALILDEDQADGVDELGLWLASDFLDLACFGNRLELVWSRIEL